MSMDSSPQKNQDITDTSSVKKLPKKAVKIKKPRKKPHKKRAVKTGKPPKPRKKREIKINKILGFYTDLGEKVNSDDDYSYAQIELMGKHAKAVKAKHTDTNTYASSDQKKTDCDGLLQQQVLEQGYIMLISKSDLNFVLNYKWYLSSAGYPGTYGTVDNTESWGAPLPMHRFLFPNCPKGYVVDHINRNRLDNRRTNLRIITAKQNSYNRKKPKHSKSKYKGVRKMGRGKFKAVISKDGKTYEIKNCLTEESAARSYDAMAEELFGHYAGKNFPDSI